MARIKSRRMALSTLSCKFGGIGKHTPLSPMGAEDMCNFRILSNGVLRVRSGYTRKKRFSSGKKVRAVWEGTLGDDFLFFCVVGGTIYRLSGDTLAETAVGSIPDGTESVNFFAQNDTLYLLDGENIWNYLPSIDKFEVLEPYVPLYGYLWDPTAYGDIYEPINLLTSKLRVHYYNPNGETEFRLPYYANTVEMALANDKRTTNYTFSPGTNKIIFPSAPIFAEVVITISLNEDARTALFAAQKSYIYTRGETSQLFLWGNDARLFCGKTVTSPMLSSCRALYPKASPLYFCKEDILFLGDSTHPITALCPIHNNLLAFTSDRIWNLSIEEEGTQAFLAMHGMGCTSPYGVVSYESGVLAAMDSGIYYITTSTSRPQELSLEHLSIGIEEKFSSEFVDNAHLMRNLADGEIWMRDPSNTAGDVWVWNFELKEWYRFSNIPASFFFKCSYGIGFATGSDICFFGRSQTTDNGSPIDAYYKSAYLDFGVPDSIRRSMRAFLFASPSKSDCEVLFETEQKEQSFQLSTPLYATAPQLHDMRIATHRYRFLRFTLSSSAKHQTEFYRLDIYSGA